MAYSVPDNMRLHPIDNHALWALLNPLLEEVLHLERRRSRHIWPLATSPNLQAREAFVACLIEDRALLDRIEMLRQKASDIADAFVPTLPLVEITAPNP